MENSISNEIFKLKLIHNYWFIETGGKLHRLSFLKGARSVQIKDNVISADGCMYQVQINNRKEVKVEKIDDICIRNEPNNEQLSGYKDEFDSNIEDGIQNKKGPVDLNITPEERNLSKPSGEDSPGNLITTGFSSWLKKTFTTNDCQNSKSRQQTKSSNVQFFVPIKTATTQDFSNAINDLIQDNSFKCIICSGIGNLSDESPLVVVCPISSMFEPDIDFAIDGIKWKKTFVVLLLHSGLESSLPRTPTASRLAHKEKYKNIVFIDVAYTKDEKLYQCQMNDIAKNQLKSFLQNYTKNNLD